MRPRFNPSQVQFTHKCLVSKTIQKMEVQSFNPSQVQFTQKNSRLSWIVDWGFNPSQVQFTHNQDKVEFLMDYSFQSLTGSIHTRQK
jgi:hypothetical protein